MTASLLVFLVVATGNLSGKPAGVSWRLPALRRRPYATRGPRSRTTRAERESGSFHAQPDQYARAMPETSADRPHLRLERPSEGVVLLTLDNPAMRNAMS